jgi:ectoine hydroxylase-related dioxygenase (phytanoyl-CoA dioxygenase family)
MEHQLLLDPRQLADFERDGFLVVRGVFDRDEVERMKAAFERLEARAQGLDGKVMKDGSQFVCETTPDGSTRIHRIVWCGASEPILLEYGRDKRLLSLVSQLTDSTQFDQLINQAHFKFPGDDVTFEWHQDSIHRRYGTDLWTDVDGRGSFIETTTAIDPMTEDNGPLQFIPGSHKRGHIEPDADTGELPADAYDPKRAVTLTMDPGDVALFGPFTIHGSGPNDSESPRRLFLNGYALPGANRRVYPGEGAGRRVEVG